MTIPGVGGPIIGVFGEPGVSGVLIVSDGEYCGVTRVGGATTIAFSCELASASQSSFASAKRRFESFAKQRSITATRDGGRSVRCAVIDVGTPFITSAPSSRTFGDSNGRRDVRLS